jgi:dynein heavy chain 1
LDPPIESGRANLIRYFQQWLGFVTTLARIRVFQMEKVQNTTYSIAHELDPVLVRKAYDKIQEKVDEMNDYVSQWLQYQALWDLNPADVFKTLGEDLVTWCKVLIDVKKSRSIFDNSKTLQVFNASSVDYGNVQTKVNSQYDQWQRELIAKFSHIVNKQYVEFTKVVQSIRAKLETVSFGPTTEDMIKSVLFIQESQQTKIDSVEKLQVFQESQKILERQRFSFPSEWMYYDQVSGECSAFTEILERKVNAMNDRLPSIKDRIIQENKSLQKTISDLCLDWDLHKPIKGELSPLEALASLQSYESKLSKQRDLHEIFLNAKSVLQLDIRLSDHIVVAMTELQDIRSVWELLSGVWNDLENIKMILWTSKESLQIKTLLEQLFVNTSHFRTFKMWLSRQ